MAKKQSETEIYNLPITQKELSSFSTTLFEFSSDAMLILDAVGKIVSVNTSLCNLIGEEKKSLFGKIPEFLFGGQEDVSSYKNFIRDLITNGYWAGQVLGRNKSGQIIPLEIHFSAIYNDIGEANHYVGICSSIYSYMSKINELPFDPNIDPLTKLLNATAFIHRLEHNIHKVEKDMSVLSLLYIDIDNFHNLAVKDNYHAGDVILKNLANKLKSILDESYTIARLKSDKFCIVIQDVYTQESIQEIVEKIFTEISKPYSLHSLMDKIFVSIGVAIYPISGDKPQDLLASAADAAQKAKLKGGNQIYYHKKLSDAV